MHGRGWLEDACGVGGDDRRGQRARMDAPLGLLHSLDGVGRGAGGARRGRVGGDVRVRVDHDRVRWAGALVLGTRVPAKDCGDAGQGSADAAGGRTPWARVSDLHGGRCARCAPRTSSTGRTRYIMIGTHPLWERRVPSPADEGPVLASRTAELPGPSPGPSGRSPASIEDADI